MKQATRGARRASAVGALGGLAVSAFVIGAVLAGPPSAPQSAVDAKRAPGRAAVGPAASAAPDVSPASESRARDVAALPTSAPAPRTDAAGPAGLSVRVTGPDGPLTTDEPVRFRIRWSDGSGRYAGLTEDWGDGTAASSVQRVSCGRSAGANSGDLTTAHRFPAGRFRVRLTVVTAECDGRTESRTAEAVVDVGAPVRTNRPERPAEVGTGERPTLRPETRPAQEGGGSGLPVTPSEPASPVATPSVLPSVAPPVLPEHLIRTAEADRTDSDTP